MRTEPRLVRRAQRRRRRQATVVIVAAVALVGAGGAAFAMTRSGGPSYRLASVTTATVQQSVITTGTVRTVRQASSTFAVGGTVATLSVHVGSVVTSGQRIATLDRTALNQAVQTARSSVASARQTLANDEAAQVAAADTSSGTSTAARVAPAIFTSTTSTTALTSIGAGTSSTATGASRGTATATATTGAKPSEKSSGTTSSTGATGAGTTGSTASTGPRSGAGSATGSGSLAAQVAAVHQAQAKVVQDQHRFDVDGDIASADRAVAAERSICQAILGTSRPSAAPSSSAAPATTAPDPTSTSSAPAAPPRSAGSITDQDLASCQSAINDVLAAQAKVQSDIHGATADEAALDLAVSGLLRAVGTSTTGGTGASSGTTGTGSRTGSTSSGSHTGSTGTGTHSVTASTGGGTGRSSTRTGLSSTGSVSTGSRSTGSSNTGSSSSGSSSTGSSSSGSHAGSSAVITAATVAADEKSIDAANAAVTVALQNADMATLTASISGKVAAVGFGVGQIVSAGSTTATVTILGGDQKSVGATVPIADIDLVKIGTPATVTVAGVPQTLPGEVSYVGVLNTSGTSGSTSTYPVTVLLAPTTEQFYDGAGASVALHVGAAKNALTVPTSAVHHLGSRTSVDVYSGGRVTTTLVKVGVTGTEQTQVVTGLKAGQRVVLATVSAPVPTSSVNQRLVSRVGGSSGLGGSLSGGGASGGGFGGATRTGR